MICTDKTGTLTRNEMVVASVVTREHAFPVDGTGYEPSGAVKLGELAVRGRDHGILEELGRAALLCSDAVLQERGGIWQVEGDPGHRRFKHAELACHRWTKGRVVK